MSQIVLLRMWRERRLMFILFTGLCLVTSFLALGPLYVRAIAAAEFETQLNRANSSNLRIDLVNELPIDPSIQEVVTASLGDRVTLSRPYMSTPGAVCGFQYDPGNPIEFGAPTTTTGCYFVYSYPDLDELFTLVDGQMPTNGSPLGFVEALISSGMQADSGWEVGEILIYGEDRNTATPVEIVGIVEPKLAEDDPFWAGQYIFEEFTFYFTAIDARQERGLIVTEADYLSSIQDKHEGDHFNWRITFDRNAFSSSEIAAVSTELNTFTAGIRDDYPSMEIFSTLDDLLRRFEESVTTAQPPITFLSLLVLVLLLYNTVTITALIQEQQIHEWVMFASRGGSRVQLLSIQFVTVGLLNLIAILLGPVLAYGLLLLLTFIGPQAAILEPSHIGSITQEGVLLSLIAGIALQFALMFPAWNSANDSLLGLKREVSRPERPLWLRYNLDFIVILAGIVLLIRLYGLASGSSLDTLLLDPFLLVRALAEGDISTLLRDPFSIAAPVLLVLGLTLLWTRLFPLLIGALGRLAQMRTDLLMRLALWSIERDPGHYTRMVLLLIGTLALGTSSLILSETREIGAWELAQNQVGADAAITITSDVSEVDWQSIPDVQGMTSVFLLEPANPAGSLLIGVSDDASGSFPQLAEVASLVSEPDYDVGGLSLPDNVTELRVDVFAESPEDGDPSIRTALDLLLQDPAGREYVVTLNSENAELAETYATYRAEIPSEIQTPIVLQQFMLASEQEGVDTLRHRLYLDNFRSVTAQGEETLLLDFEPDSVDQWSWQSNRQGLPEVTLVTDDTRSTQGNSSLRVQYVVQRTGAVVNAARLGYRSVRLAPIPVVLSPEMANVLGQRNREGAPMEVGDTASFSFDVRSQELGLVKVEIELSVVGIRETFNFARQDSLFLIADHDLLQRQINAGQTASLNLRADTVWIDMAARQPSAENSMRLNELPGVVNVTYAWDIYNTFLREPLPNAVSGVLFAGFWISLLLSLMDFSFYLSVTLRQRASSFATLLALGWNQQRLPQLLLMEQFLFVAPALIIGVLAGVLLAGLIAPFLSLAGSQALQFPAISVFLLLLIIGASFTAMLGIAAISLRQMKLTQVMRFGD